VLIATVSGSSQLDTSNIRTASRPMKSEIFSPLARNARNPFATNCQQRCKTLTVENRPYRSTARESY